MLFVLVLLVSSLLVFVVSEEKKALNALKLSKVLCFYRGFQLKAFEKFRRLCS